MKLLILSMIFMSYVPLHAQGDSSKNLDQANKDAIAFFKSGDFKRAISSGRVAVELSAKEYGNASRKTAIVYSNLGVILRYAKKFDEAVVISHEALNIYERLPDLTGNELVEALEALGRSHQLAKNSLLAEESYLRAMQVVEDRFGFDIQLKLLAALNAANFFAAAKKFQQSDSLYVKSYDLAYKHFGRGSKQVEQVDNAHACNAGGQNLTKYGNDAFYEAKRKIQAIEPETAGTINGRAVFLPKPPFPKDAKDAGLGGLVAVRVGIDVEGNVRSAKSVCGHPILASISEKAAMKARFGVTTKEGSPIEVQGFIVYNYIR